MIGDVLLAVAVAVVVAMTMVIVMSAMFVRDAPAMRLAMFFRMNGEARQRIVMEKFVVVIQTITVPVIIVAIIAMVLARTVIVDTSFGRPVVVVVMEFIAVTIAIAIAITMVVVSITIIVVTMTIVFVPIAMVLMTVTMVASTIVGLVLLVLPLVSKVNVDITPEPVVHDPVTSIALPEYVLPAVDHERNMGVRMSLRKLDPDPPVLAQLA